MIGILCFSTSILLNVLLDNIILFRLQSIYSSIFISCILNFFGFLAIFIFKRKILLNFTNLCRGFLCCAAILLTLQAYRSPNVDIIQLSSMYYTIPAFESIIYMIYKKEYKWQSFLSLIFNMVCFFLFGSWNLPLAGILGCLLFSFSDILLSQSHSKDTLLDVCSVSFFSSMLFFILGIFIEKQEFFKYSCMNKFIFASAAISIASEVLVFYAYKKQDPLRLSAFRYIDLIFLNVKNLFYWSRFLTIKTLIPFIFMIIRLFI